MASLGMLTLRKWRLAVRRVAFMCGLRVLALYKTTQTVRIRASQTPRHYRCIGVFLPMAKRRVQRLEEPRGDGKIQWGVHNFAE